MIVGSARDMALAWRSFLAGELLPAERVSSMFSPLSSKSDGRSYGLGVMVYRLSDGNVWLGHQGSIDGAHAVVVWSSRHRAAVAVALTGEGDSRGVAKGLLSALPVVRSHPSSDRPSPSGRGEGAPSAGSPASRKP